MGVTNISANVTQCDRYVILSNGWIVGVKANDNKGTTSNGYFQLYVSKDNGATFSPYGAWSFGSSSYVYTTQALVASGTNIFLVINENASYLYLNFVAVDVAAISATDISNNTLSNAMPSATSAYNILSGSYSSMNSYDIAVYNGTHVWIPVDYGGGGTYHHTLYCFVLSSGTITSSTAGQVYNPLPVSSGGYSSKSYIASRSGSPWIYQQIAGASSSYTQFDPSSTSYVSSPLTYSASVADNSPVRFNPSDGYLYKLYPDNIAHTVSLQKSTDLGNTWTTLATHTPAAGISYVASAGPIMLPNGKIVAVWYENYGNTTNAFTEDYYYSLFDPGGNAFNPVEIVSYTNDYSYGSYLYAEANPQLNSETIVNLGHYPTSAGKVFQPFIIVPDTAPNAPTITSPVAGQSLNTRTPTVTWTFSDPDAGDTQSAFRVQVVNSAYTAVTWDSGQITGSQTSYTLPAGAIPSDGQYYIRILVFDSSGTQNTNNGVGPDPTYGGTNGMITIDTVAPVIGSIDGTQYKNSGTTVRVTAYNVSDVGSGISNVRFWWRKSTDGGSTWTYPNGGTSSNWAWGDGTQSGSNWYYDIPMSGDGYYQIDCRAYDIAGNVYGPIHSYIYMDTVAPSPANQAYSNIQQTSAVVNWSAFADASPSSGYSHTDFYVHKWDGSTWVDIDIDNNGVTEAAIAFTDNRVSYTLTNLVPGTEYEVCVIQYDSAGNPSSYAYTTFYTIPATPATPTGSTYGNAWDNVRGTGYADLSWTAVPGATGYKVAIFNGNIYEYFDVGNVTSWSTQGKYIFPIKELVDSWADNSQSGNVFNHTLGTNTNGQYGELWDTPQELYVKTTGTAYDTGNNHYWFRIESYNASGSSGDSSAFEPVIPNRTDTQPPSGSIQINTGATEMSHSDTTVALTLSVSDLGGSGATEMRLSNNPLPNVAFSEEFTEMKYTEAATTYAMTVDGIALTSTTGDPQVNMYNLGSFDPSTYRYVAVRYRITAGTPTTGYEIFFTNGTITTATGGYEVASDILNADGQWHTLFVDMWQNANFKTGGNITGWRFDYCGDSGITMEVDYVELVDQTYTDEWQAFATSLTWTPTAGDGSKTISTQFKDSAGNVSPVYSATIFKNTPPATTITSPVSGVGYLLNTTPRIKLSYDDSDNQENIVDFRIQVSAASDFGTTVIDDTMTANPGNWVSSTVPYNGVNTYIPATALTPGTYYVRSQAKDNMDWGDWSPAVTMVIEAPAWTDTIDDTYTGVRKPWVDELRNHVNSIQQARGLAQTAFTDATTANVTSVRVIHVSELRDALKALADQFSLTLTWTDDPLVANTTERKGKHWNELRNECLLV